MKRVGIAYAIFVAVMTALAAYRWQLWSFGADTGTFTQIALNALHGFTNTSERGSHFAVHWSPILIVLYPFAALTHGGLAIQVVQVAVIGAAIFPAFALLRRYVADDFAATLATVVVLYPPLVAVAFDEFHEIAFYPVLVFALLWALDAGRRRATIACAVALLLVREEALIVLACFGVVLAIAASRVRPRDAARGMLFLEPRDARFAAMFGGAFAIACVLIFIVYFGYVAPSLGGWTASHFYRYSFANGPLAVVVATVVHPLAVLRAIATPGRFTYLLEAFAPLLFLGLRSPWMWVVLPGLAIVVLSSDASAWRMGNHYAGLWAPWLLLATFERIVSWARASPTPVVAERFAAAVLVACALVLLVFDPMHPGHYLRAPYGDLTDARAAFAATPVGASAFTHDEWFAHMAGTRPALEHVWSEPDYAILADDFPHAATFLPFMRRQVAHGCYRIERRFGPVAIYRRTSVNPAVPRCRIER